MAQQEKRMVYPDWPVPGWLAMSHAVRVGDLLFTAGFTARGTPAERKDAASQMDACLEKISRILEHEGGSMKNLVKVTMYVTDMSQKETIHRVRTNWFKDAPPATIMVQVAGLASPNLYVEVDAIAHLPGSMAAD